MSQNDVLLQLADLLDFLVLLEDAFRRDLVGTLLLILGLLIRLLLLSRRSLLLLLLCGLGELVVKLVVIDLRQGNGHAIDDSCRIE